MSIRVAMLEDALLVAELAIKCGNHILLKN